MKRLLSFLLALVLMCTMLPQIIFETKAAEDYRSWEQSDTRWGSISLGSSSCTISSDGCLVTAVTKLIIQAGFKDSSSFNVATLARWLNSNSGYTSAGALYWGKPSSYISGFTNYGDIISSGTYSSSEKNGLLLDYIRKGYHMAIQVNGGGHWIAVDEAKSLATGQIYIMDSLKDTKNCDITLTSRYSTFKSVHAYKGGATPDVNSYEDLGSDFYAHVYNRKSGYGLCNVGGNVQLGAYDTTSSLWHFIKQSNGSYKILSSVDDNALDVADNDTANGTNVQTYGDNGTTAQRWYLKAVGEGYSFISASSYKSIDIYNGYTDYGTNAQIYTANDTEAQTFLILKESSPGFTLSTNRLDLALDGVNSGTVTLSVFGDYPACYANWSNTNLSCQWGEWDGRHVPLTITASNAGVDTVTVTLLCSDTDEVIDSHILQVITTGSTSAENYVISFSNTGDATMSDITVAAGESVTLPGTVPTSFGTNFKGWYYNGTTYQPGETFIPEGSMTLTGNWSTYNFSPSAYPYTLIANVVYPGVGIYALLHFSESGNYTFYGTNDSSLDCFIKLYDSNGNLIAQDDDSAGDLQFSLTQYLDAGDYYAYYAPYNSSFSGYIWTKIDKTQYTTSTISFENTGDTSIPDITVEAGQPVTLPSTVPTQFGKNFYMWWDYDTYIDYYPGQTITPQEDMTLTAYWGSTHVLAIESGDEFSLENTTNFPGIGIYTKLIVHEDMECTFRGINDSSVDCFVKLYDESGNLIAQDDDNGGNGQFLLTQQLTAGTYYIYVAPYSSAFEGEIKWSVTTENHGGTCGDNLTWTLDNEGVLTISGAGPMTDFSLHNSAPWYGNGDVLVVRIESGVTSIGNYAFYDMDSVQAICIWESVKSIGYKSMESCDALEEIWVHPLNTAFCSDPSSVLYNYQLTKVIKAPAKLSGAYTIEVGVTGIEQSAFEGCDSMTAITIPDSITSIGAQAFYGCNSLKDVYYKGTQTQWEKIQVAGYNGALTNATIHFMLTDNGWVSENGKWYYYKNGAKATGWLQDGGTWYYMDSQGVMQTGWRQISGVWYYFKSSGAMVTGWLQVGGTWYYFNASGAMVTGWLQLGSTWYYFNASGAMVTGTVTINGKQNKFDASGAWLGEVSQKGWVQEGGKWYYYQNGAKATGWKQIDKVWYYFSTGGVMQTGWKQISGVWYYFKSSGAMATGWLQQGNTWYYLKSSGAMATGTVTIAGKLHKFNASGVWLGEVQNAKTGWAQEDGKWKYYTNGVAVKGWKSIGGLWYYFDGNCNMVTGWLFYNNNWYYLDGNGVMKTNCEIDGGYIDGDGIWHQHDPDDSDAIDLKIAICLVDYNEWNKLYADAAEEKCAELGWEIEVFDAQYDANTQISQVRSIIAQDFDAMTIHAVDNEALAPVVGEAADAGIIVVDHYGFDDELGISDKIYKVLFGQKESGILQAEKYIELCGEEGKVAIIGGLTGADYATLRTEGYYEVLDRYDDIEVVATEYCDWDTWKAQVAAADILAENPDLKAFLVQDDGMAKGVWKAIEAAGLQEQVVIASQGFYEYSIDYLKKDKFLFTITYPAAVFAWDALDVIIKLAEGENVERMKWVTMEIVTKENCETALHD